MSKKLEKQPDIEVIIRRAVKAGIDAGRTQTDQTARDAYRATERRLYALPMLVKRIEDKKQQMDDLLNVGPQQRSKDIARFATSGQRLSNEEIAEALVTDIKAGIATDEAEIATIKKSLENIEKDPYYLVVKGRYFEQISDDDIAKQIPCDDRTVRRHRGRLVRTVAIWLYGAEAV